MAKAKASAAQQQSAIEAYSTALMMKSRELRASMSMENAAQVVGRPDCPTDEGDLSQRSNDEWIFLNRNKLESKVLRDVEEALRRIATESFGFCHGCDEPISRKRLDALPWAKYCVSCQERVAERKAAGEPIVDDEDE